MFHDITENEMLPSELAEDPFMFPKVETVAPGPVPLTPDPAFVEVKKEPQEPKTKKPEKKAPKKATAPVSVPASLDKAGKTEPKSKITKGETPQELFASSGELPSKEDEMRALRKKVRDVQRFSQLLVTDFFLLKHRINALSHECELARKEIKLVGDCVEKLEDRMDDDDDPFQLYMWKRGSGVPVDKQWIVIDDDDDRYDGGLVVPTLPKKPRIEILDDDYEDTDVDCVLRVLSSGK